MLRYKFISAFTLTGITFGGFAATLPGVAFAASPAKATASAHVVSFKITSVSKVTREVKRTQETHAAASTKSQSSTAAKSKRAATSPQKSLPRTSRSEVIRTQHNQTSKRSLLRSTRAHR